MSTAKMLDTLYRAAKDNLTDEQLVTLDSCSDEISLELGNLAALATGIASLIAADERTPPGGVKSGALQDAQDVSTLMYLFGDSLKAASQAVLISGEAAFIRREREVARKAAA